jgi:hypothetical protein
VFEQWASGVVDVKYCAEVPCVLGMGLVREPEGEAERFVRGDAVVSWAQGIALQLAYRQLERRGFDAFAEALQLVPQYMRTLVGGVLALSKPAVWDVDTVLREWVHIWPQTCAVKAAAKDVKAMLANPALKVALSSVELQAQTLVAIVEARCEGVRLIAPSLGCVDGVGQVLVRACQFALHSLEPAVAVNVCGVLRSQAGEEWLALRSAVQVVALAMCSDEPREDAVASLVDTALVKNVQALLPPLCHAASVLTAYVQAPVKDHQVFLHKLCPVLFSSIM